MAFQLAVYASPRRLPVPRRKTRFRLLVRLCRAGLHPLGSKERFRACVFTSQFSSPKLRLAQPGLDIRASPTDALPCPAWSDRIVRSGRVGGHNC